jgi:hypothetical protein
LVEKANALIEENVSDAEMFHLSTADYTERYKSMRKETEAVVKKGVNTMTIH